MKSKLKGLVELFTPLISPSTAEQESGLKQMLPSRGQPIEQTVENLKIIMELDAITIEEQDKVITRLLRENDSLRQRLMKRKQNETK